MTPKLTVFGEVLWDVLPDVRLAGGATMNVAAHLQRYGMDVSFISRVGHDELGAELLAFMAQQGLSTEWVQTGETHLTGIAKANVSDSNEVTYKILHPVAWDYIQFDPAAAETVAASDFFVYGTLAARDRTTRDTLMRYLAHPRVPVFDVNLRPPHYTREQVLELLGFARIVKMNEHELREVTGWIAAFENEKQAMALLLDQFRLDMIILTCGAEGAMVLTRSGEYDRHPGFTVKVADTIGSGDAFLGAFLYQYATAHSIAGSLEFACAAGAFVASKSGALPAFGEADIQSLIHSQQPAVH
ncbi:carbohydrate kinase [Dyadobacter sp. CY261]|uniref:carbohydrate kinase family protein n=1 Tax=Dyadobacter sp. CY261 TaxID=2907203 RepID=UPI001F4405C9|nr:carbohydrate kinase [Dyadobacter sp. CY261]MCF0074165.1 carbohydrate kinase [Dyadobacter sp. CY261]